MEWEHVKVEGDGPIRHLVLNRPKVHNAVNAQLLRDVISACRAINELPDCRAVIVRGNGPSFSSGADLKDPALLARDPRGIRHRARLGADAVNAISDLNAVTVAAVHGYAIGGGACIAMACDFQIGAASCQVSIREASLGRSLSWNSIPNTVHLVGPKRAKRMIIFGEMFPAGTLLEWGFFDEVVPDEKLLDTALALAERVVRQPPLPVQMTKASINALVKTFNRSVFHLDEVGVTFTTMSQDARVAEETFFSGASPEWRGE
ncbi:MAG: enoyl-CoA hydratase/isomerase family protein [Candidatus Lambdaproteobacteria bacterium]|nr:enoyl-CoA hydratase/isomerase family protein [Candidatus Lambdaproteobacteria bacterium]